VRLAEAVREASAGVWHNQWLWLPLAVAVAFGAMGWLLSLTPFTAIGLGTYGVIEAFLAPAFLAWWVGWAGDAAHGRRLAPRDIVPTLARAAGPMYMLLFVYGIGSALVARLVPGLGAAIDVLAPLILNPWIDFAAEGDLRLERMGYRMRDPVYWLVAATGLVLAALAAWAQGLGAGGPNLLPGALPALTPAIVPAYAAATWLWAVRARLLADPGVWHNARMRRFLRESQRGWDDAGED
jgi:hypothetical protein